MSTTKVNRITGSSTALPEIDGLIKRQAIIAVTNNQKSFPITMFDDSVHVRAFLGTEEVEVSWVDGQATLAQGVPTGTQVDFYGYGDRLLEREDIVARVGDLEQQVNETITDRITTIEEDMVVEGEWVDLRPYLGARYHWDPARAGKNAYPRARLIGTRVQLSGVISFTGDEDGPITGNIFENLPTQFRPEYTSGGVAFMDTDGPLWFGTATWLCGGVQAYGGATPGAIMLIAPGHHSGTFTEGAISLEAISYSID